MAHPLAVQVQELAQPIAEQLGFELVRVVFQTNQHPPVLRVDIRPQDPAIDTSHAHCEAMSQALEAHLDEVDLVPGSFVLEVSSPGVSERLTSDRDFQVFKGFAVEVTLDPPHKGKALWQGHLIGRDQEHVHLSCRGRQMHFPRGTVQAVILRHSPSE